jgi:hypothetical protein
MNPRRFYKKYIRDPSRRQSYGFWYGAFEKAVADRMLTESAANSLITKALLSGKPFLAGRMGSTETNVCWRISRAGFLRSPLTKGSLKQALDSSGISNREDEGLHRFAAIYVASLPYADLIGFWGVKGMAPLLRKYGPPALQFTSLSGLDPWDTYLARERPWTLALEGKSVLVVHPFAQSILAQFARRSGINAISEILPPFDIATLVPPVTFAGQDNGKTWVVNFQLLMAEVAKRRFDIAIIGCGAYGLPLGAFVKQLGRQAIHLGGATQLLFGIRGKRWDEWEEYTRFIDETWVRPLEEERPVGWKSMEEGCYW